MHMGEKDRIELSDVDASLRKSQSGSEGLQELGWTIGRNVRIDWR
jgi:hypothetical protein